MLIRLRHGAFLMLITSMALLALPGETRGAAEVRRFNLVISAIPTQVSPNDFNDFIDDFNRAVLDPRNVDGIPSIDFAWLFEAQLRYFVRPNVALNVGVGQIRTVADREILPGIQQDIQLRAEVLSVPVHVGGAFYLQPYNRGDFQARAYFGAGFMSVVYNRGRLQSVGTGLELADPVDPASTLFPRDIFNVKFSGQGDSPGFYFETGVHMFFASRYSIMLGAVARSAKIRDARVDAEDLPVFDDSRCEQIPGCAALRELAGREEFDIDTSGVGLRMAFAIGF